jgi:hypothetical protein
MGTGGRRKMRYQFWWARAPQLGQLNDFFPASGATYSVLIIP